MIQQPMPAQRRCHHAPAGNTLFRNPAVSVVQLRFTTYSAGDAQHEKSQGDDPGLFLCKSGAL